MKKVLLIFLFFIVSTIGWTKKYSPPKLTAIDAIKLSKIYVSENKISISKSSFINEVVYKNIYNEYKPAYWSIKWHFMPRVKGSWFEVRVFNDGKVEHSYGK